MSKKIKYGNVDFGPDEFKEENITAHISIKMPLSMVKDLKRLALNEKYEGRYQTLMKDILAEFIKNSSTSVKAKKRA